MKGARSIGLGAAAGLAAAASAQVITTPGITARLDLTWQEDPAFAHNDNGFLEPGEHALMLMTISFTGQFTVASFSPNIGTFSSGTILGLGSAYIDIRSSSPDPLGLYNGGITQPASSSIGPNANNEGTSGYGVRGDWRLGGIVANGTPDFNGFQSIGPGQLPMNPAAANTTEPINAADRLGWLPNSYSDRTVSFHVQPVPFYGNIVGLYFQLDSITGAAAYFNSLGNQITFGSVDIPIRSVPAPSALLPIIGMTGIVTGRRRARHAAKPSPEARQ